jgi:hypothetical protein
LAVVIVEDGTTSLSFAAISPYYSDKAFQNCPIGSLYLGRNISYTFLTASPASPFTNKTTLTALTLGNSVTRIGNYAFSGCTGLTAITIPVSVTVIGNYAFNGCKGITSVTIPNNVTSIGNFAFSGCSSLTGTLAIPNLVTSIGNSAFSGCSGLTKLTIGNSVTSIGSSAFANCSKLLEINSLNLTPPQVQSNTFSGVDKANCTLYVPTGGTGIYWLRPVWEDFVKIIEFAADGTANKTISKDENKISVYPNPAQHDLFIKSDTPIDKVEIYNQSGQLVLKETRVAEKINVSRLDDGIYFVRIFGNGKIIGTTKLIKN